MKFSVIHCSNGTFAIDYEGTDKENAIVNFHTVCTALWNAKDVEKATVILANEKLETLKIEYVKYN